MDVVLVAVQDDVVKVEEEDVEVVVCLDLDTLERWMMVLGVLVVLGWNAFRCCKGREMAGGVLFSSTTTAAASWM